MKHVAAAVIFGVLALPAQTPSITISGRVVADDTGDPIPNARVSASAAQGASVVLADRDGRFSFIVPSSRVTVVASKTGYAKSDATLSNGGGPIEIRLRRGAAISGRVVDEFGDPVGAHAVARAPSSPPNAPALAASNTDDHGDYRLAGLPAGSYVVSVETMVDVMTPLPGRDVMVPRPTRRLTLYPDAVTAAEAEAIRVQSGDDRRAVDFVVPAGPSGIHVIGPASPLSGAPDQNPAAKAQGVVRGRIVGTDGRPVPQATVRLSSVPFNPLQLFTGSTDHDGRFEFANLAPATFQLLASKEGYEALSFPGMSIDVRDGETRENVDVRLTPFGALAGIVVDEYGDPLEGVRVGALQVQYAAGRKRLVPSNAAAQLTDDLGRYRIYGVPPGQYVVSAAVGDVSSADLPGYTRSYFPGTPAPGEAQFVAVAAGQEMTGIDFSLSRAKTARVAGKLLNAAGEPTSGGTVQLVATSSAVTSVPVGARILPDGRFEFTNVPPGQYLVRSDRGRLNGWTEGEFGVLPVSVNGEDVTDLTLLASSGSSITGRFVFDGQGGSQAPPLSGVGLTPAPVDFDLAPGNVATADVRADGSFALAGINGPRRLLVPRVPAGWALKEIVVRGVDVTDRVLPFGRAEQSLTDVEVVLTDRVAELSGTIADDHGQPAPGAHLVIFSTARDRWYPASRVLRTAVAGATGAFSVVGLPFGTYYVAGVARLPPLGGAAWEDPEFLDSLIAGSSTVTLREGEKQSLTIALPAVK